MKHLCRNKEVRGAEAVVMFIYCHCKHFDTNRETNKTPNYKSAAFFPPPESDRQEELLEFVTLLTAAHVVGTLIQTTELKNKGQ